jgi:hypothetical protein
METLSNRFEELRCCYSSATAYQIELSGTETTTIHRNTWKNDQILIYLNKNKL